MICKKREYIAILKLKNVNNFWYKYYRIKYYNIFFFHNHSCLILFNGLRVCDMYMYKNSHDECDHYVLQTLIKILF